MRNKDRIRALLKSIETGDPGPVAWVNEATYIRHNPQTHEGSEGSRLTGTLNPKCDLRHSRTPVPSRRIRGRSVSRVSFY